MKKYSVFLIPFATGAIIYSLIEILWRGYTHWTMAIAGGVCLSVIYFIYTKCRDVHIAARSIAGAFVILSAEYLIGFIVNIVLGWNVWDYSDRLLNLFGQICPLYGLYWFILCIPANWIAGIIYRYYGNKIHE